MAMDDQSVAQHRVKSPIRRTITKLMPRCGYEGAENLNGFKPLTTEKSQ